MAGIWYRAGTVAVTTGSAKVVGTGTTWRSGVYKPDKGHIFWGPDGRAYEVDYVESDTVLYLVTAYAGGPATGQTYSIVISITGQVPAFSRELSAFVAYHQGQMEGWQKLLTGTGDVTLTAPDGTKLTTPSWDKVMNAGYGVVAQAKTEADRAKAAAASINPEAGEGELMRIGGPAILDSERYSLERATGGRQTIIRDSAGNANCMFVLPRFRYEDLGMAVDMGQGDVTAFDFGSGSIKSEIFIGAYLASGDGAVSAPRQAPRTSIDHTAARAACVAKGAGWHLMTAHEWAAIVLWCMANGSEPIGNTYRGRSHEKPWLAGSRIDGRTPGDFSGVGSTFTGSMGGKSIHDLALGGIADLVGNVWEHQDGLLLRSGQLITSTHNAQPEEAWVPQAAFFDAPSAAPVLSAAVTKVGEVAGDWRGLEKSANYISNPLLRRLLIEPAGALPKGTIIVRNDTDAFPLRGGSYDSGAVAGLAATALNNPRTFGDVNVGFRAAFSQ